MAVAMWAQVWGGRGRGGGGRCRGHATGEVEASQDLFGYSLSLGPGDAPCIELLQRPANTRGVRSKVDYSRVHNTIVKKEKEGKGRESITKKSINRRTKRKGNEKEECVREQDEGRERREGKNVEVDKRKERKQKKDGEIREQDEGKEKM